jgi:hypothetical protein
MKRFFKAVERDGLLKKQALSQALLMVVGMLLMAEQRNENPANSWHGMLTASYFA